MADPRYHMSIFAFDFRQLAIQCRDQAKEAAKQGEFVLADWAVMTKEPGGKTKIESSRKTDPGAVRGGLFGGGAGAVLAVVSGPIGVGAMLGGAAIGAITAGLKDSGFPDDGLKKISTMMRDGRSLLLLAVPVEETDKLNAFVTASQMFNGVDGRHDVDIVPGRTLDEAIEQYKLHEED